nr:MAG TPA: hypothetical protein [Caudoviricetes sp.]
MRAVLKSKSIKRRNIRFFEWINRVLNFERNEQY